MSAFSAAYAAAPAAVASGTLRPAFAVAAAVPAAIAEPTAPGMDPMRVWTGCVGLKADGAYAALAV